VLKEEIEEKSKNLDRSNKLLEKAEAQIKELENKLAEQSKNLDKSNNSLEKAEEKIKMLEKKMYYSLDKELPPLPKKQNKLKLKEKLKTKYQQFKQFIKKQKVQEQELICRVEVRTN